MADVEQPGVQGQPEPQVLAQPEPEADGPQIAAPSVAGQPEPEAERPQQAAPQAQRRLARARSGSTLAGGSVRTLVSVFSRWRWPSEEGKLPGYVRAHFRMKTFGLLSIQALTVFCIAVVVYFVPAMHHRKRLMLPIPALMGLGTMTLAVLVLLHWVRRRHPWNIVAFVAFTLLLGACWAFSGTTLATHAHLLLLGCVCATLIATTCVHAILALCGGLTGWKAVVVPMLVGLVVGSLSAFGVTLCLGLNTFWCGLAVTICFAQFFWLLLELWGPLVDCDPDTSMEVVVGMDSTLLVIVSVPMCVVAAVVTHLLRMRDNLREHSEFAV